MAGIDWKKICCAVDFSGPSRRAVQTAADLAERFGAELTILHIERPGEVDSEAELAEMKLEAARHGAKKILVAQQKGDPSTQICEFARAGGFDLVVMGTHGRTGRMHMLMGSVAEAVVRGSVCPVLTLHEGWEPE